MGCARSFEPATGERGAMNAAYDYDYIVIGSGFGGSVSAWRLTEKGYSVGVLEMGKRFGNDDFTKTTWNIRKYIWQPKLLLHGILQITWLKDVVIFHGAGVGGGSLVYANTLLVPPPAAFQDVRWPSDEDWQRKMAPFYEEAKRMLGAVEAKNTYPSDHLLREIVDGEMGRGDTFHKNTVGVYFGEPGKTVADPYFDGAGPSRTGCIECGACMVGCRFNAKNSLDKNYLYLAENNGCTIHPERKVTDVRPLPEGGYEIHTRRSTSVFAKDTRVYRCRGVVFSASVLGTVDLLARCRERGSLPDLSDRLGDYVRTNSEAILSATARTNEVNYGKGIAITSGVYPDDNTHVEIVRYGEHADSMSLITTLLTGGEGSMPRWLRLLGNIGRHPLQFLQSLNPFGWARKTAIVLVMQPLDNYLSLRMKRKLFGRGLDTELLPGQKVPTYMPLANRITRRLAERMGGRPQSLTLEVIGNTSTTAHILGGATMARTPDEGVCDPQGRVFGYENMYVADGSIVPANLGVNPSLTITALAEYVMSGIESKSASGAVTDAETEPAPAFDSNV